MTDVDARAFGSVEATVKHLTERIEHLEQTIQRLEMRIATLTQILDQARGVRVVIIVLLGAASFAAGVATTMRAFR